MCLESTKCVEAEKMALFPLQHRFRKASAFPDKMVEGGKRWMNRSSYSIARFLQFAILKEDLNDLLNFRPLFFITQY